MPTATYTIHEGTFTVEAEVSYDIHPASGDGWNEPHEPAHVEIYGVKLVKSVSSLRYNGARLPDIIWTSTDLGPAPQWVVDLIEADSDFLSDLLLDNEPDPDAWRDARIDRELMGD